MKKLIALLLAASMVLSLGVTAFAGEATLNSVPVSPEACDLELATVTVYPTTIGENPYVQVVDANGQVLESGYDYMVEYPADPEVAGTKELTVIGLAPYAGMKTATYKVYPVIEFSSYSVIGIYSNEFVDFAQYVLGTEDVKVKVDDEEVAKVEGTTVTPLVTEGVTDVTVVAVSEDGTTRASRQVGLIIKPVRKTLSITPVYTAAHSVTYGDEYTTTYALDGVPEGLTVEYSKVSGDDCLSVDAATGVVTLAANTVPGTYYIQVKGHVWGNSEYAGGSKTRTMKFVVKKMLVDDFWTVEAYNRTVKQGTNAAKMFIVNGVPAGVTLTYTKVSGDECLSVDAATGAIIIAKGTPKGKYAIKVNVRATGNMFYKGAQRTRTRYITVK